MLPQLLSSYMPPSCWHDHDRAQVKRTGCNVYAAVILQRTSSLESFSSVIMPVCDACHVQQLTAGKWPSLPSTDSVHATPRYRQLTLNFGLSVTRHQPGLIQRESHPGNARNFTADEMIAWERYNIRLTREPRPVSGAGHQQNPQPGRTRPHASQQRSASSGAGERELRHLFSRSCCGEGGSSYPWARTIDGRHCQFDRCVDLIRMRSFHGGFS